MVEAINCRYRGWRILIQRRPLEGRWAASVEMHRADRHTDDEAVTLPFSATFATAPAAAAAALEAAIIWIDRAGQSVS